MRLQKFLRDQGVGSRRDCDALAAAGKVLVNGTQLTDPTHIMKEGDTAEVNGKIYKFEGVQAAHIYLMFNKPRRTVSSHDDPEQRKTIFDCLDEKYKTRPLFYAGRLDFYSRGLMILSSDGAFINRMSHPSHGHSKEYIAGCVKYIEAAKLDLIFKGFTWEGETYAAFNYQILDATHCRVEVQEGKYHLVRHIFRAAENEVNDLVRTRIGPYELGDLADGAVKEFTPSDESL